MNIKKFIANNVGIIFFATISNFLAFIFWAEYLDTGQIYDKKHSLLFVGYAATGHLVGVSIMAIVSTVVLIKAVSKENSKSKML